MFENHLKFSAVTVLQKVSLILLILFSIFGNLSRIFHSFIISLIQKLRDDWHITKVNVEIWVCYRGNRNYRFFSKGGFPKSRNFYVRTDVNFNWFYVRKLK